MYARMDGIPTRPHRKKAKKAVHASITSARTAFFVFKLPFLGLIILILFRHFTELTRPAHAAAFFVEYEFLIEDFTLVVA